MNLPLEIHIEVSACARQHLLYHMLAPSFECGFLTLLRAVDHYIEALIILGGA